MNVISRILQIIRRRPFPLNLAALKACRISYSQFGEDLMLSHILGYERSSGVYLDLGCYKPITWSNTYLFYQRGWSGVCIDANSAFKSEWQRYRPRDSFFNIAIGNPGKAYSYAIFDKYPACNCIVPDEELQDYLSNHQPDGVRNIECRSLPDILNEAGVDSQKIDLLSIDLEGMDMRVVQMFDWSVFRPKAVVLEEPVCGEGASSVLTRVNYSIYARTGLSTILMSE
jgi:hypothetical protein